MYWLFRAHHWKPSDYLNMNYFERMTVRGFIMQESEDNKEINQQIEDAANG